MGELLTASIRVDQKYFGALNAESKLVGVIKTNMLPSLSGIWNREVNLYGKLSVIKERESYSGPYEVTPQVSGKQVLETANRFVTEDITVLEIPYYEVSNDSNGTTVFIAKEV